MFPQERVSEESRNRANDHRIYDEIWNKGNFAVLDELVAPEYVDHDSMVRIPGPEGLRQEVTRFRNAFPDLHFTVEDVVSEGDKVVTRLTATGTHRGDLPGIPATGKPAKIAGIVITRYVGGRAVEAWTKFDFLGLYRQLGAIPVRSSPTNSTR